MEKIRVGMNEANISTEETPIIGTDALGPCVDILASFIPTLIFSILLPRYKYNIKKDLLL